MHKWRDRVVDALMVVWLILAIALIIGAAVYGANAKAHADCDNGVVEACKSIGRLNIGEGLTISK